MLSKRALTEDAHVDFLSHLTFHGVTMRRRASVLVQGALYNIERMIACDQRYFVWLRLQCAELNVDEHGAWVAHVEHDTISYRLMSLNNSVDITCVYTIPTGVSNSMYVIVKM